MNELKTSAMTVRHGGIRKRVRRAKHTAGPALALVVLLSAGILTTGPIRPASAQADAPSWRYTGRLNEPRYFHTATLLLDGKVLVAGGTGFSDGVVHGHASAELYDPVTGKWTDTGRLNAPRTVHTATLLKDGNVVIVGGVDGRNLGSSLNGAELYDPVTANWSITGSVNGPRHGHRQLCLRTARCW